MQLTSMRLKNISCFNDLSLDFTNENTGKGAAWVVIVGENGTGKSTILLMIGAALLGYKQFPAVAGGVDWSGYIRSSSPSDDPYKSVCWVNLSPEVGDIGYEPGLQLETSFSLRNPQSNVRHPTPGVRVNDTLLDNALYTDRLTGGWFACGYSSWRRLAGRRNSDSSMLPTLDENAKPNRFTSLFGGGSGLTNTSDWLAGLYFQSIYPGHSDNDIKRFDDAKKALLRTIPKMTSLEVTPKQQVVVSNGDASVPLEHLSDGYKGTLAWVGDLIRRLFEAYPKSENPLKERGVVLLDEIDLHLHPIWQRAIVEDIRELFPNIQFIVTTHSPFIVQDMRSEDKMIVLERAGRDKRGHVTAREDEILLQDWSADQILSAYFSLGKGTRGKQAQQDEARYERLLDAEAKGGLTQKQEEELKRLRLRVVAIPSGETTDEQKFYETADAVVANLRRRRQELEARKDAIDSAG